MTALLVTFLQMLASAGAPITVSTDGAITLSTRAPVTPSEPPSTDGKQETHFDPQDPRHISNGF